MRLLECNDIGEFSLTMDIAKVTPAYAILSHTWGARDQEVTFKDLMEGTGKSKIGYRKIQFCGQQAARDDLRYFWVDTCCINKNDAVEVQKSINSMFRWYKNAAKCYVYLSDVSMPDDKIKDHSSLDFQTIMRGAKWFTRGWTLQELLAPLSVEFFSANENCLGDKISLKHLIHERTGIPIEALLGYQRNKFSVRECESWLVGRETEHEEDMAYSLLGLFNVFLPLIYGEGRENAFRRLREEVDKNVQTHQSNALPEPRAEHQPAFTVPFVRDRKFVGREDVMHEITNQLKTQRRVALCGIGGIG